MTNTELRKLAEAYPMEYDPIGKTGKENLQRCLNYNAFIAVANPAAVIALLDRTDDLEAQVAALAKALQSTKDCLETANALPNGPICDTIWYSETETLFDYIDAAIESQKATS